MNVIFFENGNSYASDGNEQITELSESWIKLFFNYMVEQGYDPLDFTFSLPNGRQAKAFETEYGYNWEIK